MDRQAKVTIAGAGALGLACAVALADAGCTVTVCDPAEPADNASGVAAGMIAPSFEAVLDASARPHFDLLLGARDLWPGLAERTGVALRRDGAMAVGDETWLEDVAAGFVRLGLHAAELPAATARALAPGLAAAWPRALLTREDWRIDPVQALSALRNAAAEAGVTFRREAVGGRGDADLLVVATGSGAERLAPELSALSPIKGHILRARAPWAAGVTVRGQGAYAAPGDGVMTIGATMEAGVADAAVDPAKAEPLRAAAARLFPDLAGAPFELSAGVRAATPDGLPLVGYGAEPRVILAAGARRNGWLLAPLVGRMVAAFATGADPGADAP
ncbi:FAD-binding oxidoreductase [Phenylobacterium sp. J426]|uniref:NAD(P)/FAD-dependent oxidoreductase n=1 Tax=Phenylobacterium sp. J426 TaxID=2898439 RepID=UPI0021516DC7|nr:FAD-dependent oxidoreductase [Phenylobacterium sp. J426]MCR5875303.1 FAD-binding oxidoreductase [Phenylobacterium sp. J426]